jgi:DNA-binding protein H-NS
MAEGNFQEIMQEIARLQVVAADLRKQEIADAVKQVQDLIAKYELTEMDVFGRVRSAGGTRTKAVVAPKYRDPNTGATWTGRGRKPTWVVKALDSGMTMDQLAIQ